MEKKVELWDAYNEDGTKAGFDLVRGEDIPKGYFHAVAEVFVMHEDGDILVMQRDFSKPNSPGKFETGGGGSVLKGETFYEGAVRELFEETGVKATELTELYHEVSGECIYQGYLCITDMNKDDIVLQEGETIGYRWLSKEDFLEVYYSDMYLNHLRRNLKEFVIDRKFGME